MSLRYPSAASLRCGRGRKYVQQIKPLLRSLKEEFIARRSILRGHVLPQWWTRNRRHLSPLMSDDSRRCDAQALWNALSQECGECPRTYQPRGGNSTRIVVTAPMST